MECHKIGEWTIIKNHYIQFEELKHKKEICHLFTTKPFNFNSKLISEVDIQNQYNEIQKILGCSFEKIVRPIQTHTNIVKAVTSENLNDKFQDVDGIVTNLKNIALVTSLADCQGILLYDSTTQVIGNVHSGWKGTLNKIVENAIKIMVGQYGCKPQNISAYIAPSILKCCFEVDEDVKEKFEKEFQQHITYNPTKHKYYIDTIAINKQVMAQTGILPDNIHTSSICTKCNSDIIHSYRAEGITSGRNIVLIALKSWPNASTAQVNFHINKIFSKTMQ